MFRKSVPILAKMEPNASFRVGVMFRSEGWFGPDIHSESMVGSSLEIGEGKSGSVRE